MAAERGVTAAQIALAWLLAQGNDIVPIPGARKETHLVENAAAADIVLTDKEQAAIEAAIPTDAITGHRYSEQELRMVGL